MEWHKNALEDFEAFCRGFEFSDKVRASGKEIFSLLTNRWDQFEVWNSHISDGGVPYEFSVAMDGGRLKLRFLIEASPERVEKGFLHERFPKLDMTMHDELYQLCNNSVLGSRFHQWFACDVDEDEIILKTYFNPQLAPEQKVRERFPFIPEHVSYDRIKYISIDIGSPTTCRQKVYITCRTEDEIEQLLPGGSDITESYNFNGKNSVLVCLTKGGNTTIHIPVRFYFPNDQEVINRLASIHPRETALFRRGLERYVQGSLESYKGLITYVSYRGERLTLYIAAQPQRFGKITFGQVFDFIDTLGEDFSQQKLITRIRQFDKIDITMLFKLVCFHIFTFQDIIRIISNKTALQPYKNLLTSHYMEDKGHQVWYLNDCKKMDINMDADLIFSDMLNELRDCSYAMINEVLNAKDDLILAAISFYLEETGDYFFPQMKEYLEKFKPEMQYEFFGARHLDAENSHEIFEKQAQDIFKKVTLTRKQYGKIIRAVSRIHKYMVGNVTIIDKLC